MKILLIILFFLAYNFLFSQPGKDCNNPYIINSIPFTLSAQTTQGYGNDYDETMACNSLYMSGEDFVFQYTPSDNINVTIELTNTNVLVGLFILDGCPDQSTTNCIAKNEASNGNPKLSNIALTANTTYYIIIDTYNVANLFPSTNFSFSISESYAIDVKNMWMFKPRSGCHLNEQTLMQMVYRNVGTDTIDTVVCGYQIDDNPPFTQTHVYTLAPDEEVYFTFSQHADLSSFPKTYKIKMYVSATNDENPTNDTITKWITHGITVSNFPYFEDFENDDGAFISQWISDLEQTNSWEWGQPNAPVINHAASGNNCWATNLSGNYMSPEDSYLLFPCMDFTNLTYPVIEMDLWYKTAVIDIAQLEYSLDSAYSWHRVGNTGEGINWYTTPSGYSEMGWNGNSGGWVHALHTLDGLGGKSYVLLRLSFRGGVNGTDEGIAVDNVKISESPDYDISIDLLKYPYDSCGLSENEKLILQVTNYGLNDLYNIPIKISIDSGLTFTNDTIRDTLSFSESILYTTTNHFDFSQCSLYNVIIFSNLSNDENRLNDTIKTKVMNYPIINSFPYIEDFETSNGLWYSSGSNNSWEWGVPNDTVLTNAASGTHLWATNLSGYHNMAEESYTQSPCFDLTSLQKPLFKSWIWYDEIYPTYCQVQVNNGISNIWETLGSANDSNWYNAGYSWSYTSNGWKQVKHSLSNYNNFNRFSLKYYFKGTVQSSGFAFDKVEICDAPTADFIEVTPNKGGYYVYFVNQSQRFDSCLWNFGDGSFSTELSPIHQYSNSDSVLVTLTVWNSCDTDSVKKYVHPVFISVPENNFSDCINVRLTSNNLIILNQCHETNINIEVTDIVGKIFIKNKLKLKRGLNSIALNNLNKLQIYFIRLYTDNYSYTIKTQAY